MRLYFDNAATSPMMPEVIDEMTKVMHETYGNPSSIHAHGREARVLIEKARKTVAECINASTGEIFFTSGGTESNNMALKCAVRDLGVERIITSPMEHHCVLHAAESLQRDCGIELVYVELHKDTVVDHADLERLLSTSNKKTLVSFMHANNETGCMIKLQEVADIVKSHGALFHTDTVQSIGHFPLDVQKTKIDFLSGAAHKFHGPKGVGFIYINGDNMLKPLIDGGSQERNMRAGTENIYGIVGLAKALELSCQHMNEWSAHIKGLRSYMLEQVQSVIPDAYPVGGFREPHLYTVLNISFPASPKSKMLLMLLDMEGVSASGGSACSSGSDKGSHVLSAMSEPTDRQAVRFSFSHYNTRNEVDTLVSKLAKILQPAGEASLG